MLFVVRSLNPVQFFVTPWTAAHQASLSFTLPELAQTHVHWVGDAIQPSHPLSPLLLLPSIFPSMRVFSSESALCIMWPKYWSTSPSSEYSGLISLRTDWFVYMLSKGLSRVFSISTIVWRHQFFGIQPFFIVQLSYPYMTTGKTIALTICTFVSKIMSLLFNTLFRFVIVSYRHKNRHMEQWNKIESLMYIWFGNLRQRSQEYTVGTG